MPFAEVNTQKIFYEIEGDGETIVLIHDLLEDHLHWKSIQKELSKEFRVLTLDLRGAGQSSIPKEEFTVEDMAKDVLALTDHLKIEKFHLIGDSLGGCVAQMIAYKHPESVLKMILSNSYLKISNSTTWFLETLDDLFKSSLSYSEIYKLALPWFFSSWFLEFEEAIKDLLKEIKNRKYPTKSKGFHLIFEALKKFDSTRWVSKIKAETLLIIGEEDLFCLFKESRALLTKLKEHKVELFSGGHKSKLESPTRYLEITKSFLKKDEEL
ncbi:MAG: 3-oxoadipate enol-lactonase 2 [Chlamydiae bacterium]|nr:3-oxoadipate enol-lactonase 2 [Chlamydiota bacterium]